MRYLGGAPLELPPPVDPCIIFFSFSHRPQQQPALATLDQWRHSPIHCRRGWEKDLGARCRKPIRLQLSLKAVVLRTESSDTLYSVIARTWTPWCGASCLPPRGQSHRQRLACELPENPSMKNPSLDVEVTGI
jgi:hypothetical protein